MQIQAFIMDLYSNSVYVVHRYSSNYNISYLLSVYYVLGAELNALHVLSYFILITAP